MPIPMRRVSHPASTANPELEKVRVVPESCQSQTFEHRHTFCMVSDRVFFNPTF